MAGFTIPNTPDSYNQNQAEPDSLDFQILGNQTNAVVSGAEVSPGPSGATVAVSSGEVIVGGVHYPVSASASLALTAYASSPFFDIVIARLSSGSISLIVLPGASGANPVYPAITSSDVVLAAVWRPANTTPTSQMIVDKRLLIPATTNRVSSGTPASGTGANGESYVNSSWSAGSTLAGPLSVKVGGAWYNLAYWPSSGNFSAGTITATLNGNASTATSATSATSAGSVPWSGITSIPALVYNNGGTYSINITGSASSATNATYASSATDSVTADYLNGGTNVDPIGGEYIGYSNNFGGWTVQGNFRVTSVNFYATGLGTTPSSANLRVLGDGRIAYNTSVRSVKDNIEDITDGLSVVNSLRPRSFTAKPQPTDTAVDNYIRENVPFFGFIVDEVEEDAPQLLDYVSTSAGVTPVMWKTNDLIALLTKSVQQLSARLDALEAGNG